MRSSSPQLYKKNDAADRIEPFILGMVYYAGMSVLHTVIWSYCILHAPLGLTTLGGAFIISQVYFLWQYSQHSDYYQQRYAQLHETLLQHKRNEAKRFEQYMGIFIGLSVLTAIGSLVMKETLQDITGQLISFSYISLPILFTAMAIIALLTVYLAIKPLLSDRPSDSTPYMLSRIGSYLTDVTLAMAIAAGCGYCFAVFYGPFIPTFTLPWLPASKRLSIMTLASIIGLFAQTILYMQSSPQTKKDAALDFQQVFSHLFQRENSFRRIITTGKTILLNVLWASIAATVLFSLLHFLPFALLPALSSATFIDMLPSIILTSIAAQAVVGLCESALTKPTYDGAICNQERGFIKASAFDTASTEILEQKKDDSASNEAKNDVKTFDV